MKQIHITKSITDRSDPILNAYLKDVSRIPLLSEEEEDEINSLLLNGDKSKINRLIEGNLRFVITVAKQYQGQGTPLMDLINEGNYGLTQASHKYKPEKGVKFLSYAVWWIKQAIVDSLTKTSRTVRLPLSKVCIMNKVNKESEKFEKEFGRKPTYEELSKIMDVEEDKIFESFNYATKCVSIHSPFQDEDGDGGCLLDVIPNEEGNTDDAVNNESTMQEVASLLDSLPVRERSILQMCFGIGVKQMTLEEIGNKFGLTSERVRQIKENTLSSLKEKVDI